MLVWFMSLVWFASYYTRAGLIDSLVDNRKDEFGNQDSHMTVLFSDFFMFLFVLCVEQS